ncbi:MAG: ParB N-terminal domain-containing protein [Hespellia sp.]|nr:ParB N-terminal domain-containing protein [Hespellia sp.]
MAYLKFEQFCIDKEFEELLPVLTPDEFNNLEQSIIKSGLLDPIKVWQDPETDKWLIIDGHNRYNVIKKNKLKFDFWNGYKIIDESDGVVTREDVKRWMLEQQLGRRNLTEVERYEIVQKFKSVVQEQAKSNQSSGGKGLSNLSKVNTRKEMAKQVGVSEGTYGKLDKVMQSDNEKVKTQLREKKISVDKAYKEIKKPEPITPMKRIEKYDNRMNEIDREIAKLRNERNELSNKRSIVFITSDIECELKYKVRKGEENSILHRTYVFYIESDGRIEVIQEMPLYDEIPNDVYVSTVHEKYRNDFLMLYKRAYTEEVEYQKKIEERWEKAFDNKTGLKQCNVDDKDFYKKCFRILAKNFHPDSDNGNIEDMQNLNELKKVWNV